MGYQRRTVQIEYADSELVARMVSNLAGFPRDSTFVHRGPDYAPNMKIDVYHPDAIIDAKRRSRERRGGFSHAAPDIVVEEKSPDTYAIHAKEPDTLVQAQSQLEKLAEDLS